MLATVIFKIWKWDIPMTSSIDFHGFLAHLFWVTSKLVFSILYLLCLAMNLFSVTSHFVVLNGVIVFCFLCHIRFAVPTRLKKADVSLFHLPNLSPVFVHSKTSLFCIYRASVGLVWRPSCSSRWRFCVYFIFAKPQTIWCEISFISFLRGCDV